MLHSSHSHMYINPSANPFSFCLQNISQNPPSFYYFTATTLPNSPKSLLFSFTHLCHSVDSLKCKPDYVTLLKTLQSLLVSFQVKTCFFYYPATSLASSPTNSPFLFENNESLPCSYSNMPCALTSQDLCADVPSDCSTLISRNTWTPSLLPHFIQPWNSVALSETYL